MKNIDIIFFPPNDTVILFLLFYIYLEGIIIYKYFPSIVSLMQTDDFSVCS